MSDLTKESAGQFSFRDFPPFLLWIRDCSLFILCLGWMLKVVSTPIIVALFVFAGLESIGVLFNLYRIMRCFKNKDWLSAILGCALVACQLAVISGVIFLTSAVLGAQIVSLSIVPWLFVGAIMALGLRKFDNENFSRSIFGSALFFSSMVMSALYYFTPFVAAATITVLAGLVTVASTFGMASQLKERKVANDVINFSDIDKTTGAQEDRGISDRKEQFIQSKLLSYTAESIKELAKTTPEWEFLTQDPEFCTTIDKIVEKLKKNPQKESRLSCCDLNSEQRVVCASFDRIESSVFDKIPPKDYLKMTESQKRFFSHDIVNYGGKIIMLSFQKRRGVKADEDCKRLDDSVSRKTSPA